VVVDVQVVVAQAAADAQVAQVAQVVLAGAVVVLHVLVKLQNLRLLAIHLVAAGKWFKLAVTVRAQVVQVKVAHRSDADQAVVSKAKVRTNAI
jgi:hypothetical protein